MAVEAFKNVVKDKKVRAFLKTLSLSYGVRAIICMLPMLVALALGRDDMFVPLGQAGFFYSMLPVFRTTGQRAMTGILMMGVGLAFYLVGANVASALPWSLVMLFISAFTIGWVTSFESMGWVFAPTLITVLAAGLNSSSVDKANTSYFAFSIAMMWGMLISLLPVWKPLSDIKLSASKLDSSLFMYSTRLAFASTLALAVAYFAGFSKYGWPVSAVGSVVRNDPGESTKRAFVRMVGVVVGAVLASTVYYFFGENRDLLIFFSVFFAFITGLTLSTNLKVFPFGYNATILILYGLTSGTDGLFIQRIAYNLIGALLALAIVEFGFPRVKRFADSRKYELG